MAHLEHLQLGSHKGLKKATLTNLGKINVLCGPNNSGKTTVLECISDPAKRIVGLLLTNELVQRLVHDSASGRMNDGLQSMKEAHKLIALIDNDPGSSHVRKRFLKNCGEHSIEVVQLERYSIENYFSLSAISSVMHATIPAGITQLNPKERVSDQLQFEVKGNGGKIAKAMTIEDIKGTDLFRFLTRVSELLKTDGQQIAQQAAK